MHGNELILITMNNGRDPARKAIESAFDYYKSVLRQIHPVNKQPTVPGIAVNYMNSPGQGIPFIGFMGSSQQQDDNGDTQTKKRNHESDRKNASSEERDGEDQIDHPPPKRGKGGANRHGGELNPAVMAYIDRLVAEKGISKNSSQTKLPVKPSLKEIHDKWRSTMCPALRNGGVCTNASCRDNHGKHFGEVGKPCTLDDCVYLFSPRGCKGWHPEPSQKVSIPDNWGEYQKNGRAVQQRRR